MDKACEQAMTQINNRNYANGFFRQNEEVKIIYQYGIACHLKKCRAIVARVEREK